MSAHQAECKGQSVTKTEDFLISKEDYETMKAGGMVTVPSHTSTRACEEFQICIEPNEGPGACGFTAVNHAADQPLNISFYHQVFSFLFPLVSFFSFSLSPSRLSLEATVFLARNLFLEEVPLAEIFAGATTSLTGILFWTAVRKIQINIINCPSSAFGPERDIPLQIEDSEGNVFTQRMTWSGDRFNERSIKVEVPPTQRRTILLS